MSAFCSGSSVLSACLNGLSLLVALSFAAFVSTATFRRMPEFPSYVDMATTTTS